MESSRLHPEVATEYLKKKCSLGRELGPFSDTKLLPDVYISCFGVIASTVAPAQESLG